MAQQQTMRFASALSDRAATPDALREATDALERELGPEPVDLAIVFGTSHHRGRFEAAAGHLAHKLRPRTLLGLTGAGVLGGGREVEGQPAIALLAARMPGVEFHTFTYEQLEWPAAQDDLSRLRQAIIGSMDGSKVAGVMLFADPFSTPMVKLIPAINHALPGVPVIGGLASGGHAPGENRLMLNDTVRYNGAIGLALSGNVRLDCTVSQGCRPVGKTWVITRCRHNIIQELGGQPAVQVAQQTARDLAPADQQLLRQGLFVGRVIDEYKPHFGRGDFLVRNIIGADEGDGYIAVSDLIRTGQTIQFQVRDRQSAVDDLRLLLESQKLHGPAAGALLCTCNGRGVHMFGKPDIESNLIREALGPVPLAGFFAAGEIGPIGAQNFLHGFTASLAVFRPADP